MTGGDQFMLNTLIIIPTFNEVNNIRAIHREIKRHAPQSTLLFVDDTSEDGTLDRINDLVKRDSSVHLLQRPGKQGLGTAYIAGFKWGLERDFEVFQQIDCDLSHDPAHLPFIAREMERYDGLVGSRYVRGGKILNWPFDRQLISRMGSLYSRVLLNLPIKDMTGGFNCWHRRVLESIDLDGVLSVGFSVQIELKYLAVKKGFRIKEFPICYIPRKEGVSKMPFSIVFEALLIVLKLKRYYKYS